MRGTDFSALNDRDSELTRQALRAKCEICRAAPQRFCTDAISGRPLQEQWGRWCHIARVLSEAA